MRLARPRITLGKQARRAAAVYVATLLSSFFVSSSTETAVANGDTRTLNLYHSHTGESIQATFRVNGSYDPAVLAQLNHFLRDWRNNDETHMDPRLFDVIWEVYRTAGATQPVVVYSAYRSPETNAMLRARSHAVAEYSQHILGKAMDTTMPGMSMEQIREIGMRLQRGGVGYYPRENFVHLDVGNVRYWPRMSYEQLARIFPDGKSVDLAADGRALPRYEEARAEITARGGVASDVPQPQGGGGGLFAWLFGNHDREEEAIARREAAPGRGPTQVASLDGAGAAASSPPARMTAAERRAARAAAKDAPALAAIAASNPPDAKPAAPANATQVAALAQPAARAPEPSPAPVPTPVPREKDAAADQDAGAPAKDLKKDKAEKTIVAEAPLPPSRPMDLVAYADVPTPPSRPEALLRVASLAPQTSQDAGAAAAAKTAAKPDAISPLARAASLPVVITRGPKDQPGLPSSVLGYAASPDTAPRPRRTLSRDDKAPEIISARLDRSNYNELTSEAPTAETPPQSVLGQAITGLRQAARIIPDALSAMPLAGYKMAFSAASSMLDSAHFTKGPATSEQAQALNRVSIVDASKNPPAQ
ncbi:conserved hypothetical protein [Methylocella tundrae]|uniref:Murein endopeptidase K n=1 Tax=Methylocella tundrae TaxID=227605 RepID=A0A8B6MB64_METTU|nr:DUF882 domain-containing protein [Methylocella tundrae]VTZ52230.1 conserved hypothetical protein [Methylocella tundrae]